MFSQRHRQLIRALGAALFCVGALTVSARAAGVTLVATAHYAGHFKYGEWLPLRILLLNDGPAVRAEIRADTIAAGGQTLFIAPVELPTGARKRVTLYVQPPSFAQAIRVRVMDGANELGTQFVPVTVERNVNYVIGVIAPRRETLAGLRSLSLQPRLDDPGFDPNDARTNRPVVILPIPLADIPDRAEGLRPLDALIISDTDTSELSSEQKQSLQTWVTQGGRVIIGGGASAMRTVSGLPAEWQQAFRIAGNSVDLTNLGALEKFAGQTIRVAGPFPAIFPTQGTPLILQDGNTWVTEKRIGAGFVDYCALDVSASPFDAWAGNLRWWEKLLTPGSAYPVDAPVDVSPRAARANSMAYVLQNLPALALPSVRGLGALLIAYILLVGPINYFVLRRARQLAWGWVTIPSLTFLFAIGAFGIAAAWRGNDVIINQISILRFDTRAASAQTFIGIFSPERATYTLHMPAGALPMPLYLEANPFGRGGGASTNAAEIVESDPTQLRGVQVNQYAMQAFQVESLVPAAWHIESNVRIDDERVRGSLTNRTSQPILDAVIVLGNRYAALGNVPAEATVALDHTLINSKILFPNFLFEQTTASSPRESQVLRDMTRIYFRGSAGNAAPLNSTTLIGWMRASPLDAQILNTRWKTQQFSLVVAELNAAFSSGMIRLPPGTLALELADTRSIAGFCSDFNQLYIGNGSVNIEFRLPENLAALRVTRMALIVQNEGNLPGIQVLDREGNWNRVSLTVRGRHELPDPERLVLATGAIRLRLTTQNGAGCTQFDLDVEGELK